MADTNENGTILEDKDEMGSCISKNKGEKSDSTPYTKEGKGKGKHEESKPEPVSYDFEEHIINEIIMPSGKVSKAAIVDYRTKALRAWNPPDFHPIGPVIDDVVKAFDGDTSGLAERCIDVGCGVKVSVPGKIDMKTRAIYGNDGQGGGTSVYITKETLLFVVFEKDPTAANRIADKAQDYMVEKGY